MAKKKHGHRRLRPPEVVEEPPGPRRTWWLAGLPVVVVLAAAVPLAVALLDPLQPDLVVGAEAQRVARYVAANAR